jgi:membrane glycosyltransferase
MAVTILTCGIQFTLKLLAGPHKDLIGDLVKVALAVIIMVLAIIVSGICACKWVKLWTRREYLPEETEPDRDLMRLAEGIDVDV